VSYIQNISQYVFLIFFRNWNKIVPNEKYNIKKGRGKGKRKRKIIKEKNVHENVHSLEISFRAI
jgi:hypothetical protein